MCLNLYFDSFRNLLIVEKYAQHLLIELTFISENAKRMILAITFFETKNRPVATKAYNVLRDLQSFLENGKTTSNYGPKTDALLGNMTNKEKGSWKKSFQVSQFLHQMD